MLWLTEDSPSDRPRQIIRKYDGEIPLKSRACVHSRSNVLLSRPLNSRLATSGMSVGSLTLHSQHVVVVSTERSLATSGVSVARVGVCQHVVSRHYHCLATRRGVVCVIGRAPLTVRRNTVRRWSWLPPVTKVIDEGEQEPWECAIRNLPVQFSRPSAHG